MMIKMLTDNDKMNDDEDDYDHNFFGSKYSKIGTI